MVDLHAQLTNLLKDTLLGELTVLILRFIAQEYVNVGVANIQINTAANITVL